MQIHDKSDEKFEDTIKSIKSMCKQIDAFRAADPDGYAEIYAETCAEFDRLSYENRP